MYDETVLSLPALNPTVLYKGSIQLARRKIKETDKSIVLM